MRYDFLRFRITSITFEPPTKAATAEVATVMLAPTKLRAPTPAVRTGMRTIQSTASSWFLFHHESKPRARFDIAFFALSKLREFLVSASVGKSAAAIFSKPSAKTTSNSRCLAIIVRLAGSFARVASSRSISSRAIWPRDLESRYISADFSSSGPTISIATTELDRPSSRRR